MTSIRRNKQYGAAILMAMLTVVLVSTLAAAVLWQQWRGIEVERAERARQQSSWILTGALDWARLILREHGRTGGPDYLSEPWAVPLEPARLSSFLAQDSTTAGDEESDQTFLSGRIQDAQARMNIVNLVASAKIDPASYAAFERLFHLLNLPATELSSLAQKLLEASTWNQNGVTQLSAPLWPQKFDQLRWLGLSPSSLQRLRPYVVVLPQRTPLNLNTASAEAIYASVPGLEMADAQRLVRLRGAKHFSSVHEAGQLSGKPLAKWSDAQHSVASRFFEVQGSLRIEATEVHEVSMVQRDGLDTTTLWSQHSVTATTRPLQ